MAKLTVPDDQRLSFSVDEAASRLGVSGQHLRNRIALGKIPLMDKDIFGDRDLIPAPWLHSQVEKALKVTGGM